MVTSEIASRHSAPTWVCRWCRSSEAEVVLDLGDQAPADLFPLPDDPEPDPVHPLVMVMCTNCSLAQLEVDPTSPDEPRGVEPAVLVAQAHDAIEAIQEAGYLPAEGRLIEHPSPHGGSWVRELTDRGLVPVAGGEADVVVDAFGLMHEADQRKAMQRRADELAPGGTLFLQFHSLAAILRLGSWNALRHGHFAYYSSPVLIRMAGECGLKVVETWRFDLYGGTVMLAFRRQGTPSAGVDRLVRDEIQQGVVDPARVATLQQSVVRSIEALRACVHGHRAQGRHVAGYGAASRTVALLSAAGLSRIEIEGVGDASVAKSGRCLPQLRIPVITPVELVARRPDRVLLFVPDLAEEVRRQLPEVEAQGGRWIVLDPLPRELAPDAVTVD